MPPVGRVLAVGVDAGGRVRELLNILKNHGHKAVVIPTVEELLPTLDQYPDAVILLYNGERQDAARRLLDALNKLHISRPVIVLVDRPDFDQYYELMCQGAFDYFDLDADPAWLARSLSCAGARLAA